MGSSWVPLRTAPPEPLCSPSTSYAASGVTICSARLRERRCGGHSYRGRALQKIRCQASQALQSYHNAYKLLHQPARAADDPVSQPQQGKGRPPSKARPAAPPQPGLPQPVAQTAHQGKAASGVQRSARTAVEPTLPGHQDGPPSGSAGPSGSDPTIMSTTTTSTTATTTPSSVSSNSLAGGSGPVEAEDLRPYVPHSVSLPYWQPPPTSLQHRTALTRAITTCPSYTRLHQLIMDNAADFNTHHTCAALNRLLALHGAGLTPRESRLFKEGCSTLQTILRRQLPELQPRSLVVAAYSLARLELPDRELLSGLAAAVEPHLSALQPQGLSSLLWSFARQNHQPPPKWMDAALSACAADLATYAPRDLATVVWALARLHYKVAPARLKQLLEHATATLSRFCGRSLSNLVYSLALSQQHPGDQWLEAAQARAVALGPDAFSPQGMTQLAWGLAKLAAPPAPAFVGLLLEHAAQRLPLAPQEQLREREQQQQAEAGDGAGGSAEGLKQQQRRLRRRAGRYGGIDLATLMYSLATLGAQPRADLGRRLLAAVHWELSSLEPNGMCNCLWACARLRLYPTKMWMSTFFDASYRQLPYFKPVDLSQTLWALARLQAVPPPSWMTAVMTRLQHTASMFSPVEVANTMWALARLGVRGEAMPGEVLALFFIATDRRLSSFKPQELSSMIWALATMRRRPDKEWAAEFLKVTYHKLGSMNGWCLATLAWSLSELSLLPPPAWVYSYVNAARTLMNTPPAAAAATAPPPQLAAAAALPPAGSGAGGLVSEPGAAAAGSESATGLSAIDLGQIITALRKLNGVGGKGPGSSGGGLAKVDEFLAEAEQRLAALEAGSAAYARQQLGAFLAMSPRQAGLSQAVVLEPPPMAGPEPSGDAASAAAAVFGSKAPQANRRRRWSAETEQPAAQSRGKEKRLGRGVGGRRRAAAAVAVAGRSGAGDGAEPGVAAVSAAAVTSALTRPGEAVRVVDGGARVTLAAPPDVRVDLGGDLSVDLPGSQSGPVLWRPAAAVSGLASGIDGGGNGKGNGGSDSAGAAAAAEDAVSSTAEIKRRLLAV